MHSKGIHFKTTQFRILSDDQIEELHLATIQVLERTGINFDCQEAIDILGQAGADVSNPKRVKIPSYLVEQALRTAPKSFTLYTREGEPLMVLNGMTGSHFGGMPDAPGYLDPFSRQERPCHAEDIADTARLIDALPNIEWMVTTGSIKTIPGAVADMVAPLQVILNSSKPVTCCLNSISSLREVLKICSMVAGGEKQLQARPFFIIEVEPVSPLTVGKEVIETSLLCAEKGVPICLPSMPMAGATAPASFPGTLVIANAECLGQLVLLQLKKPGAPVVFGSLPSIMDMKSMIFSYGAPEMSLLVAALTEISHYYKLPMWGTAGAADAKEIDAQAGIEVTYQILATMLSGADYVHDVGYLRQGKTISPEIMVLTDEVVDMVRVLVGGMEINDETVPLDLIERVGPGGTYISEKHTLKHFRKFWVPTLFDRTVGEDSSNKRFRELLNEKTVEIMKTHQPKALSEDLVKELRKVEASWFRKIGAEYKYPKRP